MEELYLIYVVEVGKDCDGLNVYHLLFSTKPEDAWKEGWEEVPSCNVHNLQPEDAMYEYVAELRTDLNFNLIQDNCCFSVSDCKDHCVSIMYENINGYEEFPEPFRLVFQYGDTKDDIESALTARGLSLKFI